ncbi:hypothetical protein ABNE22_04225 [Paenibacillus larvae]
MTLAVALSTTALASEAGPNLKATYENSEIERQQSSVEFGQIANTEGGISARSYETMATGESLIYKTPAVTPTLIGTGSTTPKNWKFSTTAKNGLFLFNGGWVGKAIGQKGLGTPGKSSSASSIIYTPGIWRSITNHSVAYSFRIFYAESAKNL